MIHIVSTTTTTTTTTPHSYLVDSGLVIQHVEPDSLGQRAALLTTVVVVVVVVVVVE